MFIFSVDGLWVICSLPLKILDTKYLHISLLNHISLKQPQIILVNSQVMSDVMCRRKMSDLST